MQEIWKDVQNYENYQISNLGNVFSKKSNKKLCISHNDKGYCYVQFYKNGKGYHLRLHRLVAKAFLPNPNNFSEINHIDGNKYNNCVSNLEWCSRKYNMQEAFNNGLIPPRKENKGSFPRKAIEQYNLSNELLRTYSSISEASKITGYTVQSISRYCRKQRKCKDYIWRYANK